VRTFAIIPALNPPSRQRSGESGLDPGRFMAGFDGRVVIIQSSRQPFLDAAVKDTFPKASA
jgi:hypothetical protein